MINPSLNLFLAPGPTKVHPELVSWLEEAAALSVFSRSHRSSWFEDLFAKVSAGLREILSIPTEHTVAFTGSATEVWERCIENLIETSSFHIVNGEFSERWYRCAEKLGRAPQRAEVSLEFTATFDQIEVPQSAEMMCITQNETSIGMWVPEEQINNLANNYPEKLLAIDMVSSAPQCMIPFDKVDCAFFSVQKGFALPAGLGVVVMSERALKRAEALEKKLPTIGSYHTFLSLASHAKKNQTPETPNVLGIFLLHKAIEKYKTFGIEALRKDTLDRAIHLKNRAEQTGKFRMMVKDPRYQSPTVLAFVGDRGAEEKRKILIRDHGVYLGGCYGELKDTGVRIANFPVHTVAEHETAARLLADV